MTAEEAYNFLSEIIKDTAFLNSDFYCYDKEMKMAVEALKKQIPKRPLRIVAYTGSSYITLMGECPTCKSAVRADRNGYCYYCGQALDWRENGE